MYKLYQAKYKTNFLESVNSQDFYNWLFDKTFKYEDKFGKDLFDFDKKQIMEFLSSRNAHIGTLRSYMSSITAYAKWADREGLTRLSFDRFPKINNKELKEIAKVESSVIHIDTINKLIGKKPNDGEFPALKNAQDRLMIYLIFLGVSGNAATELINLRKEHIDWDNKLIKLSELDPYRSDITVDDFGLDLIKDALNEREYVKYLTKSGYNANVSEKDPLNGNSGYIFRKTARRTEITYDHMSYQGIQTRLATLSNHVDIKLNINRIKKSGMTYVVKLLQDADVIITKDHPAVQKSLFDRFNIEEEQRKLKVIREARKAIKEVY